MNQESYQTLAPGLSKLYIDYKLYLVHFTISSKLSGMGPRTS